ncbi:prolipoprotein diacylglyceryl transferase [Candidatus Woesearchaeota archaeon CG_4_10_14_0_2_um_filter_33_13]|nr:MAG: prolipoprotein diacylglyceryl transferase [Candidatus Woesearchaeota archaeon CG_4_10_14_0_2_um_filter_33_13]
MWVNNLNPTLLHLGPLEIRWYGIIYVLGFFISIWWLHHLNKKGKISLNSDQIWDLVFYLTVGVLIGSRLFEVFWEPNYYLSNPLNFLKFWQGGMSFHGGFVGIVVAAWIYCRKHKLHFWRIADALSVPTIFALALGRIANFINGELAGRVFNGSWCVIFPHEDNLCRHPSTLYAAGKRFLIFGWLYWLTFYQEFKPGFIFWNFVFWENLGRFIVDFYRQDVMYNNFTVGQWLSAIMVLVALYFFYKNHGDDCKQLFRLEKNIKKKSS